MARESDPTLKTLVETAPESWLALAGRPPARVTVEDADLATVVSAAVDKVLRVHANPPVPAPPRLPVGTRLRPAAAAAGAV